MAYRARKRSKYDARKLEWLKMTKRFLWLVVIIFLVFRFVVGFSFVNGVSMRNTLQSGDLVLYTRINPSIKRGDIVSMSLPTGEYYVKRVLAVGGDTVDLRDGVLYVNGIAEEGDYFVGTTLPEEGNFVYPYDIPMGDIFTVGDNREASIDSRFYGTFSLKQVTGVLRLCLGKWFVKML
ncbi:MAG: signal peptidase I [Clostridia bacterium]|nr:signal peptidase I [Clostridia bacterium]